MREEQAKGNFGRHRKIMPFEPDMVGNIEALRAARDKAASLNQHVLGYGETAEREWAAAGIAAPICRRCGNLVSSASAPN